MKVTPGDSIGCRALWCGIIEVAISDSLGRPSGVSGQQKTAVIHAARSWFRANRTGDFQAVCALAGIAPGPLRKAVLNLIEQLERAESDLARPKS